MTRGVKPLDAIYVCTCVRLYQFMDHLKCTGSVAERSKALVLGPSLFGGVGSNPTAATDFEM